MPRSFDHATYAKFMEQFEQGLGQMEQPGSSYEYIPSRSTTRRCRGGTGLTGCRAAASHCKAPLRQATHVTFDTRRSHRIVPGRDQSMRVAEMPNECCLGTKGGSVKGLGGGLPKMLYDLSSRATGPASAALAAPLVGS